MKFLFLSFICKKKLTLWHDHHQWWWWWCEKTKQRKKMLISFFPVYLLNKFFSGCSSLSLSSSSWSFSCCLSFNVDVEGLQKNQWWWWWWIIFFFLLFDSSNWKIQFFFLVFFLFFSSFSHNHHHHFSENFSSFFFDCFWQNNIVQCTKYFCLFVCVNFRLFISILVVFFVWLLLMLSQDNVFFVYPLLLLWLLSVVMIWWFFFSININIEQWRNNINKCVGWTKIQKKTKTNEKIIEIDWFFVSVFKGDCGHWKLLQIFITISSIIGQNNWFSIK